MNKRQDWQLSSQALRSCLRQISKVIQTGGVCSAQEVKAYKFNVRTTDSRGQLVHSIYNGAAGNLIAYIVPVDNRVRVVYRENSHYAEIIKSWDGWTDYFAGARFYPAPSLRRRRSDIGYGQSDIAEQTIERVRNTGRLDIPEREPPVVHVRPTAYYSPPVFGQDLNEL